MSEVAALRAALEWYADPVAYSMPVQDMSHHVFHDRGETARKALKAVGPLRMVLHCPAGHKHVDEGEWASRPHKTHQCQKQVLKGDYTAVENGVKVYGKCGLEWRPSDLSTVGVEKL